MIKVRLIFDNQKYQEFGGPVEFNAMPRCGEIVPINVDEKEKLFKVREIRHAIGRTPEAGDIYLMEN